MCVIVICEQCGQPIFTFPSRLKAGRDRFCSVVCAQVHRASLGHLADRLRTKANHLPGPDGCWLWTGWLNTNGYGLLRRGRAGEGFLYAHRVAYEIQHGPIPPGKEVCHSCDVKYSPGDITYRRCIRPDHLFLGTHRENVLDSVAKRRHTYGDRHPQAKLTGVQAIEIRVRYAGGGSSQEALGREYGISQSQVSAIVRGENWCPSR